MAEFENSDPGNDHAPERSQVEILRQLVGEAEKWSDLLLKYNRSMILYFIPATVLAVTITILHLYWTVVAWESLVDHIRFLNTLLLIVVVFSAVLAIKKEVEALIRYRANKKRHTRWRQKFDQLRDTETKITDMLTTQESGNEA